MMATTDPQSTSSSTESSKVDVKPEEAQPETAQNQPTDPSTDELLEQTVSESSKLTDPAMEDLLRGET